MSFTRPALSDLISRAKADVSSRLGTGPLLKRSILGVLAEVMAGSSHQLYGYLDYIARQIIIDTADGEHLSRWASIWAVQRKPASYATGLVDFIGANGSVIPAATRLQRADGQQYDTTEEVTISGGAASAAVIAVAAGASANAVEGASLQLVSPVQGVQSSASVGAGDVDGGADEETDDALRARLLERLAQPPHGGADFDYVAWAKQVPGVTRAWCYPLNTGAGTVGVAIVSDDAVDGPIPSSQLVDDVQEHIDAVRPVTAAVTVFAPIGVPLDLSIGLAPDTTAVRTAVEAELRDMLRRDAVPAGTIYISRIREAISLAAGENNHSLTSPTVDVTHTAGQLAVLGTITWL